MVLLKEAREQNDARLVEACREGDPSAFDELVRRHKDRVYNVLYRFLGNHEDALDVAQEVFVRAYRSLDSYRGESQVYTWLYRIAANMAKNRLRDRTRKGRNQGTSLDGLSEAAPGRAQAITAHSDTPRAAAEHRELNEALEECLGRLPETFRFAFVLRTFDGLAYDQIAEAAGCPRGTVKSRLNQARKRLHDCLQQNGVL